MVNVVLVAPAAIVTLAGTVVSVVSLVLIAMTAPPVGAGLERITVAVEGEPPTTEVGLSVSVNVILG